MEKPRAGARGALSSQDQAPQAGSEQAPHGQVAPRGTVWAGGILAMLQVVPSPAHLPHPALLPFLKGWSPVLRV